MWQTAGTAGEEYASYIGLRPRRTFLAGSNASSWRIACTSLQVKSLMRGADCLTNRNLNGPAEFVREKGLHSTMLHAAAFSGDDGVWDAAVKVFKEEGLLDEVDTERGRTVHHLCSRVGAAAPLILQKFALSCLMLYCSWRVDVPVILRSVVFRERGLRPYCDSLR